MTGLSNLDLIGVTSTMLIMAIIGCLSPTLFYQFFGSVSFPLHYMIICY